MMLYNNERLLESKTKFCFNKNLVLSISYYLTVVYKVQFDKLYH